MDIEEPERPKPHRLVPQPPLDPLGLAELDEYVAALQAEIQRASDMIARKDRHRNEVAALFAR